MNEIDLWELNEAFAVQVLCCADTVGIPMDRLIGNGGAIAMGHPYWDGRPAADGSCPDRRKARAKRVCVTMCIGAAGVFLVL